MHVLFRYWMTRMCIAVSVPATIKVRHVWSHLSVQCQWGWMMAGTRYSLTCPTLHAERMEPTTSKHSVFRYLLPSQRNMNILECSACCFTHETLCFYFSIFCRRQGVIRLLIDNLLFFRVSNSWWPFPCVVYAESFYHLSSSSVAAAAAPRRLLNVMFSYLSGFCWYYHHRRQQGIQRVTNEFRESNWALPAYKMS